MALCNGVCVGARAGGRLTRYHTSCIVRHHVRGPSWRGHQRLLGLLRSGGSEVVACRRHLHPYRAALHCIGGIFPLWTLSEVESAFLLLPLKYPSFNTRFNLPWRSPPSRPEWTAGLPYKARCIGQNSTSRHVTSHTPNKQYYPHKCGCQYIQHNNASSTHHRL